MREKIKLGVGMEDPKYETRKMEKRESKRVPKHVSTSPRQDPSSFAYSPDKQHYSPSIDSRASDTRSTDKTSIPPAETQGICPVSCITPHQMRIERKI
jgi:hypothetical protein